jgi:glycosyltransferase involved in cell wall biosynthesis
VSSRRVVVRGVGRRPPGIGELIGDALASQPPRLPGVPCLTLVIPIHNEEGVLTQALERVRRAPCPIEREWILVDDRSTDATPAILAAWVAEHGAEGRGMRVITRPPSAPAGKGAAIAEGFKAATGDFVVVQDADLEYDPADIPALLQPLLDDEADVVYGSRFRREGHQVHRTFHYLGNRALTAASNMLSGIYLSDMETCYKLFRADLVKAMVLRSNRFGVEVEMTAYLGKARVRVYELPITYFPRTHMAGKKIGWKDGVAALGHLVRFNLLTTADRAFSGLPEHYRV